TMQKLVIGALLLSALSECVLVSDMSEKVFLFPVTSATAYVSLIPQMKKPLENFTLCMKAFSDLTRPYSLFSYSTYTKENEVLLFVNSAEEYMFYVGNEGVTFRVPPKPYDPV
ncbi:hypothetical protein NL476_27255, partial [Klebsiella pneumoniae]|nr:hypothetical protein [Klebsiella pneumoniae]